MSAKEREDKITSLLAEGKVFDPPEEGRDKAWVKSLDQYREAYQRSMDDPEGFWAERAEELVTWDKKWDTVVDADLTVPEVKWFDGGKLNVSYNCLDRHQDRAEHRHEQQERQQQHCGEEDRDALGQEVREVLVDGHRARDQHVEALRLRTGQRIVGSQAVDEPFQRGSGVVRAQRAGYLIQQLQQLLGADFQAL